MSNISESSNKLINDLCKICKISDVPKLQRYPNLVCYECEKKAIDINGNIVKYSNIDSSGGFVSRHYVKNVGDKVVIIEKCDPYCWIDGIKCIAQESRFGSIVIQMAIKNK